MLGRIEIKTGNRILKQFKGNISSTKTLLVSVEELLTTEPNVSTPSLEIGVIFFHLEGIELTFHHRVDGTEPLNERGCAAVITAAIVTGDFPQLWTSNVFHLQHN